MSKLKIVITTLLVCLCSNSLFPFTGTAKTNGIEIWHETFGNREDPALLMVMGGLCQGILWPTEFCEKLAQEGFYVIRYDNRDTGFSSCFDYEKAPYDLLDMAKDGIGLLDALDIGKAHVCGLSMGGPIAELMSVHFPERVSTITLIATSCDLRPCSLAFDGLDTTDMYLSKPLDIYLEWMDRFLHSPPQSEEEQLEERVKCWAILNGSKIPFEEKRYREIHREFLARLKHPESLTNHLAAIRNSFDMIRAVPSQVKVPTLVIQGTEDPILPPDHGKALSASILHSRYLLVDGFGHVPNCHFYDLFSQEIKHLAGIDEES